MDASVERFIGTWKIKHGRILEWNFIKPWLSPHSCMLAIHGLLVIGTCRGCLLYTSLLYNVNFNNENIEQAGEGLGIQKTIIGYDLQIPMVSGDNYKRNQWKLGSNWYYAHITPKNVVGMNNLFQMTEVYRNNLTFCTCYIVPVCTENKDFALVLSLIHI